jgi:hypothetical protein
MFKVNLNQWGRACPRGGLFCSPENLYFSASAAPCNMTIKPYFLCNAKNILTKGGYQPILVIVQCSIIRIGWIKRSYRFAAHTQYGNEP